MPRGPDNFMQHQAWHGTACNGSLARLEPVVARRKEGKNGRLKPTSFRSGFRCILGPAPKLIMSLRFHKEGTMQGPSNRYDFRRNRDEPACTITSKRRCRRKEVVQYVGRNKIPVLVWKLLITQPRPYWLCVLDGWYL